MAVIGKVSFLFGTVFAEDAAGNQRLLSIGDEILEGERIITVSGAKIEMDMLSGDQITVADGQSWSPTGETFSDPQDFAAADATLSPEDLALQEALLTPGADPTQFGDATAAGNPAAGAPGTATGDGGTSFVTLERTGDEVDPEAGFETTGLNSQIVPPVIDPQQFAVPTIVTVTPGGGTTAVGGDSVVEGNPLVYTITLSSVPSVSVTFPFSIGGGTASESDYGTPTFSGGVTLSADGTSLTVPPGVASFEVTLPTVDDTEIELTETVPLTIGGVTGTGNILDNDKPDITKIQVANDGGQVTEGEVLNYTVTLSEETITPVTYPFTLGNGTASTIDYSTLTFSNDVINNGDGTITVPVGVTNFTASLQTIDDNEIEPTETVLLTVDGVSATGGILDNDFSIEVGNPETATGNIEIEEGADAVFGISVKGAPLNSTITLSLENGTALDADYFTNNAADNFQYSIDDGLNWIDISGPISIGTGESSILVRTDTFDDAIDEKNEFFTLNATLNTPHGDLSSSAQATIIDNDKPTIVIEDEDGQVSAADNSVVEATGNTVTGTVTVSVEGGVKALSVGGVDVSTASGTNPIAIPGGIEGDLVVTSYDVITGIITYSYTETGGADSHNAANDNINDSFVVSVTNSADEVTTDNLDIQILDTESIANDVSSDIGEDTSSVTGSISVTSGADVQNVVTVQSDVSGQYGSFSLAANGVYTYNLNTSLLAVQELNDNESLSETFSYTITDADGDVSTANVVITINGSNELPQSEDFIVNSNSSVTAINFATDTDHSGSNDIIGAEISDAETPTAQMSVYLVTLPPKGKLYFDDNGTRTEVTPDMLQGGGSPRTFAVNELEYEVNPNTPHGFSLGESQTNVEGSLDNWGVAVAGSDDTREYSLSNGGTITIQGHGGDSNLAMSAPDGNHIGGGLGIADGQINSTDESIDLIINDDAAKTNKIVLTVDGLGGNYVQKDADNPTEMESNDARVQLKVFDTDGNLLADPDITVSVDGADNVYLHTDGSYWISNNESTAQTLSREVTIELNNPYLEIGQMSLGLVGQGSYEIRNLSADYGVTDSFDYVPVDGDGNVGADINDGNPSTVTIDTRFVNEGSPPVAVDDYGSSTSSGLMSEYYAYQQGNGADEDGGNLLHLEQIETFIADRDPDATFIARNIDYQLGSGDLGGDNNGDAAGTNLVTFLGGDAQTLSDNNPTLGSDAILSMRGLVSLDSGSYTFKVLADDGYSIKIDGVIVAVVDKIQSPHSDTHPAFEITTEGLHSIEILYWDQAGDYVFQPELSKDGGDYLPLTAANFEMINGYQTTEGEAFTVSVAEILANDSDPDMDLLSITEVSDPLNGTVSLDGSGNIVFVPAAGYSGPAQFDYTITDGNGGYDTATVFLTVTPDMSVEPVVPVVGESIGTNVLIMLDVSGSMKDKDEIDGDNVSRIDTAKAALQDMLNKYHELGDVRVQLATFSDKQVVVGSAWMSIGEALIELNNIGTPDGGTNYDYALDGMEVAFNVTDGKLANAKNVSYFLSDGVPTLSDTNPGNGNSGSETNEDKGDGIDSTEQIAWQNFVDANNIKSHAVAIGDGVAAKYLKPIAYDGESTAELAPIISSSVADLSADLIASVVSPGHVFTGTAADDLIVGGLGEDFMTGNEGADTFAFTVTGMSTNQIDTDTINDFNVDQKDVLDLSDLLKTAGTGAELDNYLNFEQQGLDTLVHVNKDGDYQNNSSDAAKDDLVIRLKGVDLTTSGSDQQIIDQLLSGDNLLTDQLSDKPAYKASLFSGAFFV